MVKESGIVRKERIRGQALFLENLRVDLADDGLPSVRSLLGREVIRRRLHDFVKDLQRLLSLPGQALRDIFPGFFNEALLGFLVDWILTA